MASAVSVCSNALLQLGDDPIASFNENTKRARFCANIWPQCRDWLQRQHPWSCLRVQVLLAPESTEPEFDWGYSFLLPGDWLRTIQVGERGKRLDHEHIGRRIYADTNSLPLIYVQKQEDPAQWDAALVDLATSEMTARLAYPITQSASLAELKRKEANMALRFAKAISGQDNPPEDWGDSPFIDARF